MRETRDILRVCAMTFPFVPLRPASHGGELGPVMAVTRNPRGAMAYEAQQKGPAKSARPGADRVLSRVLVDPGPGLAAAEHAAEGTALDAQGVGALQRDRGIIAAAGIRIENPSAPLGVLARLHVNQNLLAILVRFLVDRITTEIVAALLDADLAFLLFRQPDAKR